MDIIDDVIDLFYQYSRAQFIGSDECEVCIDDERGLREKLEKLLTEK